MKKILLKQFLCGAISAIFLDEIGNAAIFSDKTSIGWDQEGTLVPSSVHRTDHGAVLKWQSVPGYAYIIEQSDAAGNWQPLKAIAARHDESHEQVEGDSTGTFFRVLSAPQFAEREMTFLSLSISPYVGYWALDQSVFYWQWDNEPPTIMQGAGVADVWKGIYTSAGPHLLALTVVAPDGSKVSTVWAMTITNSPTPMIECSFENDSAWLPGETKRLKITWEGISPGDPYKVFIRPTPAVEENYGFILARGFFDSARGHKVIELPYPTPELSVGPYSPRSVFDGTYIATVYDMSNNVSGASGPIDTPLILEGVRVRVLGQADYLYPMYGDTVVGMNILVDARFSHHDVSWLELPLILGVWDEDLILDCALYDDHGRKISQNFSATGIVGHRSNALMVDTVRPFRVEHGTKMVVELRCQIKRGVGYFEWFLDPSRPLTVVDHKGRMLETHVWVYGWTPSRIDDPILHISFSVERSDWGSIGLGPLFDITH